MRRGTPLEKERILPLEDPKPGTGASGIVSYGQQMYVAEVLTGITNTVWHHRARVRRTWAILVAVWAAGAGVLAHTGVAHAGPQG